MYCIHLHIFPFLKKCFVKTQGIYLSLQDRHWLWPKAKTFQDLFPNSSSILSRICLIIARMMFTLAETPLCMISFYATPNAPLICPIYRPRLYITTSLGPDVSSAKQKSTHSSPRQDLSTLYHLMFPWNNNSVFIQQPVRERKVLYLIYN